MGACGVPCDTQVLGSKCEADLSTITISSISYSFCSSLALAPVVMEDFQFLSKHQFYF